VKRRLLLQALVAVLLLAAGFGAGAAWAYRPEIAPIRADPTTAAPSPTGTPTQSPTETSAPSATATPPPIPSSTSKVSPTAGPSLTPSRTPTITLTPTIDYPEARVRVQANCRYGPGAAYLYEWGLYPGDRVTILGRNDLGDWVYVDPWYFIDRCWVNTALLDISGDLDNVPPFYGLLPFSELYQPPTSVTAVRDGNDVHISWPAVWMTEDDYRGYLIEAWVCRERQIVFTPVAIDGTTVTIVDEPGCLQPSSGRLFTAEKHGYTAWRRIAWPPHPTPSPTATEDVGG
jgi:hypothetical protein